MTRYTLILIAAIAAAAGAFFAVRGCDGSASPEPAPEVNTRGARDAIPVPEIPFADIADSAGVTFTHTAGHTEHKLLPETMGSGVAFVDYDRDGKPDLFLVNSRRWPADADGSPATCAMYHNLGGGKFQEVSREVGLDAHLFGMGVAVGDIDNDGWPDLFVSGVGGNRFFRNVEGERFEDVTESAGLAATPPLDSFPTGEAFFDSSMETPFGSSTTFLDYDGDADLDLFLCHYVTWSPRGDTNINSSLTGLERAYVAPTQFPGANCSLYRNDGGFKFTDVSAEAGVRVEQNGSPIGKSLGVIACDPDDDGWPDLIVANDQVRNFFFHNIPKGDGRTFEEVGLSNGIAYASGSPRGGMGIDVGEYRPDSTAVVIANFANEPTTFFKLDGRTRLSFNDHALSVGIYGPSRQPLKFGTFFFDADLDGRLDILTANGHLEPEISSVQKNQQYRQPAQFFWNTGGSSGDLRQFEPATAEDCGEDLFTPIVGRGSAFADIDGDGDLDLVMTSNGGRPLLLRNDVALGHHWVRLRLVGDGERSNRDAVGAEVEVHAGDTVQRRRVTAGRGYLSQSELTLTFGLGEADRIDKVIVRWPGRDGGSRTWEGLAVDRVHELRQADGT